MSAARRPPDPARLGGLTWLQATGGRLTRADRGRLLGAMARGQVVNLAGRAKLALGIVPPGARDLSLERFTPPDSRNAREAEAACAEQTPAIIGHSYRSWSYGCALLALDRRAADPELFYTACLLHDAGLLAPVAGEDFTLRSGQRAAACARSAGLGEAAVAELADAIAVHTTPGVDPERDGVIGAYVQAGAMVDLAGFRAWDLAPAFLGQVLARHPRSGFTPEIIDLFRAEARAVPEGRFAFVARWGFILAMRLAPFAER